MTTYFKKVSVGGLFKWGKFVYIRLDASKHKNMLAVNLSTAVTERFDADNLVRPLSAKLTLVDLSKAKIGVITLTKVSK